MYIHVCLYISVLFSYEFVYQCFYLILSYLIFAASSGTCTSLSLLAVSHLLPCPRSYSSFRSSRNPYGPHMDVYIQINVEHHMELHMDIRVPRGGPYGRP